MDWKGIAATVAPLLGAGGAGVVLLWREIRDIDKKVDRLGALLTHTLIAVTPIGISLSKTKEMSIAALLPSVERACPLPIGVK